MVRKHSLSARLKPLVVALGTLYGSQAMALGLGELKLDSFLNEPLDARIKLIDIEGLDSEQVRIKLATRDDFELRGVDRVYFLTKLQFEVETDSRNQLYIKVTSDEPVLEPYLDFIVEARWPSGRLLREYTLLLDPPAFEPIGKRASAARQLGVQTPDSGTKVKMTGQGSAKKYNREFGSDASPMPIKGEKYMVQRHDTLWQIADRARPEGVSVNQTMLDIQRLNPEAFVNGNINLIKAGYVVYLPKGSEIQSGSAQDAKAEVDRQTANWRANRAEGAEQVATLRIADDSTAVVSTDGAAGEVSSTRVAELEAEVTASAEQLEKAQRDNDDLTERLAVLEEQYQNMERVVRLKDDQIAALQEAMTDEQAAPVKEADIEEAVTDAQEIVEKAEAKAAAEVAREKDGGFMAVIKDNLLYILGALAAGIGGLFWWMRRRRDEDSDGFTAPIEPKVDHSFDDVQLDDTELEIDSDDVDTDQVSEDDSTDTSDSNADDDGTYVEAGGDAAAEADTYLAYGRYDQAVGVLTAAIKQNPDKTDLRLKLIEIGVGAQDQDLVKQQYSDLLLVPDAKSALAKADKLVAALPGASAWAGASEHHDDAASDVKSLSEGEDIADELVNLHGQGTVKGEEVSQDLQAELDSFAHDIEEVEAMTSREALEPLDDDLPPSALGDDAELEKTFENLVIGDEDLESAFDDDSITDGLDLSDEELDSDEDEGDMVIASEVDEAATKMDLARAYLDMGDNPGARLILEEVLADDDAGLYADEARKLLDQLD